MEMENFGGGGKTPENTNEAKPKRTGLFVTPPGAKSQLIIEEFEDGTSIKTPIKGLVDGKERINAEIDNTDPKNPLFKQWFSDGSYSADQIEYVKISGK